MTDERTGVRLELEHKQEAQKRNGGKREEGDVEEKANICLPPLCVALNENPNTGKDSVEGRPAAVLLKGSYL